MNNAAAAVADACDKAAPSPCASGCGELPSLPPVGQDPPADSQPVGRSPPSLPLGIELQGRLLNPRRGRVFGRGRVLFGGEQLWDCFSCGHRFTGDKITAFQHCSLSLYPQLVLLTAPWKAGAGVRLKQCCWKLLHFPKLKGRQSALEKN